ncbi:purine-nucleoside phosphorylase [Breznakia sp. PF5-3]|uniref:purine-nucleoside phosphorylase n=1 Tax=unclassified Breznakia TaxID=2623764 RepID=UPI0024053B23|nr:MULTISPECIES: purine-nucleoside phosphorylase [unclassified Breznakia]MDF9825666.1 purine-nucleoside phosphorylase [Breznakia sp. PM6-1]MDF9836494.1 purine-nucleoside phosphorylase [Breznakia sp. PF5-3]MDF9838639.1 purine-nucleoside phosphorylase [Breznakia sp. PFB2-8]MDF9860670.1 purine-nucleoside phosphorylase [Breznakia sp. PH5-24]
MATPHIEAKEMDIAKVVLMPGDPLRAKYIAETYLEDVIKFNNVRNMFGFTGTYKGKRISVMGSGMGMPSIGIYSYELFKVYDVEAIIRIGSAGAYTDDLKLFDIVLASDAWSESSFALAQAGVKDSIMKPSEKLNTLIKDTAASINKTVHENRIHSSDVFYHEDNVDGYADFYSKHGCVCVEMESFALFHTANLFNKQAACLLTISDSLVTHEVTTAEQRQNSFNEMMEIALESAIQV